MMSINIDTTLRIMIFGLKGSGRKWFIQSLPRSIAKYASDPNFDYRIEDVHDKTDLRPILPSAYNVDEKTLDVVWCFKRIPQKKTYAHVISAHTHVFNIICGEVEDISRSFQDGGANFIFILLDPSKLSDFINPESSSASNFKVMRVNEKITRSKYVEYVKEILDEIAFSSGLSWNIGVCVVKSDLLDNTKTSWNLVRSVFGESMVLLFQQYKTRFPEMMSFRVTSFGYYLANHEIKPNPNPILYDDVWQPEVEAPFFWAFEIIEKQRIMNSSNLITRLFFNDDRKKLYLPYPSQYNPQE